VKMRTVIPIFLIAALMFADGGCIAVQYPSRQREQDADAARMMRRLAVEEGRHYERHGHYSAEFSDFAGGIIRGKGPESCIDGYCYLVSLTSTGYELRGWPERSGESGYRSFFSDESGLLRFTTKRRQADSSDEVLH
jgi:hypothetical protein